MRPHRITIRPTRPDEAALVSALALRSKAHWGYDAEFLEACRSELTWTPEQCGSGLVHVAETDGGVAGFYALDLAGGELDALFVDPSYIGSGLGKRLLRHALDRAAAAGCATVGLDADPGSEPFYAGQGARRVGTTPSVSMSGRELPRMVFELSGGRP